MKRALILCVVAVAVAACPQELERQTLAPAQLGTVDHAVPFLKAHMRDGSLYILRSWTARDSAHQITGSGAHYAADRSTLGEGQFTIALDSVALFETNVTKSSPGVAAMAVVTGIVAGVALYCASNPKACFGSCPTFYMTDGTHQVLQAEGFSASIAPALEARDVDALTRARPAGKDVRIDMANEAYETHVVRYANLLAFPKSAGRRVFHADDDSTFWWTTNPAGPAVCRAPEGDCRQSLAAFDGVERFSAADSFDLAAREVVDLQFDGPVADPALIMASRQSLLPTYLLYQAFAYLGSQTTTWLARLPELKAKGVLKSSGLVAALGGIDVLVENASGGWDSVATVSETGPLAADVRVVRLPRSDRAMHVRLRMAKGAWRVDWVGLASVQAPAIPQRILPGRVFEHARLDPVALSRLTGGREPLVTFPGDRYGLVYELPGDASGYELFLETRGYYLEWMRSEWIAEESRLRAAQLFLDPAGSMRRLAPAFKREEPGLEAMFWRSKYAGF